MSAVDPSIAAASHANLGSLRRSSVARTGRSGGDYALAKPALSGPFRAELQCILLALGRVWYLDSRYWRDRGAVKKGGVKEAVGSLESKDRLLRRIHGIEAKSLNGGDDILIMESENRGGRSAKALTSDVEVCK